MQTARKQPEAQTMGQEDASRALFTLAMAVVATVALLVVMRPSIVRAQGAVSTASPAAASTTVHVVKAGETLWSLAARYYGDGHKWQELARTNKLDIDKQPLKVGMRLTVPSKPSVTGAKAAQVAAAPADSSVPRAAVARAGEGTLPTPPPAAQTSKARTGASLASQTAGKGDASQKSSRAAGASATAAQRAGAARDREAAKVTVSTSAASPDTERLNLAPSRGTLMGGEESRVQRVGLLNAGDQAAARKPTEALTVFHRDIPDAAEAERRALAVMAPNVPVSRRAEYEAAPFLLPATAVAAAGSVAHGAGAGQGSGQSAGRRRFLQTDLVELTPARGTSYRVGERLVVFRESSTSDGKSAVAVPTGVLEVVSAESGKLPVAVVRQQTGAIETGQRVIPSTGEPAARAEALRLSAPDISAQIRWLDASELMPTLQSFAIIGAGSDKGLRAGDEVAFYSKPAGKGAEMLTATARVVRVDAASSTVIIVRQYGHEIASGMTVRRFAKAP